MSYYKKSYPMSYSILIFHVYKQIQFINKIIKKIKFKSINKLNLNAILLYIFLINDHFYVHILISKIQRRGREWGDHTKKLS